MERKFQGDRRIEDGGLCILFWLPSSLKLRRDRTPQNIEALINANNIIRITKVGIVVKIFLRRGCNCRPVWVRLGRIDFIAQTHSVFTFYLFLISAMKGYSSGIASRCIKPILSRSSVLSTGFHMYLSIKTPKTGPLLPWTYYYPRQVRDCRHWHW